MSLYPALVALHASIGTVALITYWIAGFAKKGSPRHRKVGRIYLWAMLGILLTALPMAAMLLTQGRTSFGLFMLYLVVITGNSCWSGLRAVTLKRDHAAYIGTTYRWVAAFTGASGLAILAYGWAQQDALLIGFSSVGIIRAAIMLRLIRKPATSLWALREHLGSMIGNGVATHIAFLSVGLGHAIPPAYASTVQTVAWFGPLALATLAGVWFGRRYRAPVG